MQWFSARKRLIYTLQLQKPLEREFNKANLQNVDLQKIAERFILKIVIATVYIRTRAAFVHRKLYKLRKPYKIENLC